MVERQWIASVAVVTVLLQSQPVWQFEAGG
jgi:hypothetical protein